MSYSSVVFNVMIASPGDVASERAIIRDVVYEWNAVHAKSKGIVLLPLGWESHSSPEMGATAQTIINKQILDKCDLLVGVFWTRLGTPTEEYASGTVEEIERHIASGKPAMLYFSSQPVRPDSVDSAQYALLKEFKDSCQGRGLYQDYDSHSDFKDKFYRHLQLKVNEHEFFMSAAISQNTATVAESRFRLPNLSSEARILLKEASKDIHGHIAYLKYIGGCALQANGKNFITSNERREIAKWEDGLHELQQQELIVERGHKGELFEITNLGYQVADTIVL